MAIFTIEKGKHYCNFFPFHWGLYMNNPMKRTCYFDESCFVLPSSNVNDTDNLDINKLFGFSIGYHVWHSARIGWVYNYKTNKIDLYCYMHVDGKIFSMNNLPAIYLCSVSANQEFKAEIYTIGDNYRFTITTDGATYEKYFPIGKTIFNLGYFLSFYCGGNLPARQTMKVLMTK